MVATAKRNQKAKESALYSARCSWHRYWSHRDLCGRARGTRHSSSQEFATFTEDLHRSADRLMACQIKTVAMESTGLTGSPFPDPGAPGFGSLPGQRPPYQRGAWARNPHPGLPAAAIPPHVGFLRGSFRLRRPFLRFAASCATATSSSRAPRAKCCSSKKPLPDAPSVG